MHTRCFYCTSFASISVIRKWLAGKHWEADSVGVYPSHQLQKLQNMLSKCHLHPFWRLERQDGETKAYSTLFLLVVSLARKHLPGILIIEFRSFIRELFPLQPMPQDLGHLWFKFQILKGLAKSGHNSSNPYPDPIKHITQPREENSHFLCLA